MMSCGLYFDQSKPNTPTLRSWSLVVLTTFSYVIGLNDLDDLDGRFAGVAPEAHSAREKVLETRVQSALEAGKAFDFNGTLYAPVSGVSLK